MMSCNFAIHATCLLTFIAYKYNELQVFVATQKLNCKPKLQNTPFSHSEERFMSFAFSHVLARIPPLKVIK
jgi:hypothetical protein